MSATTIHLFEGDKRLETLLDALLEVVYERGNGLPTPSVLGVVKLLEHEIITNAMEAV